MKLKYCDVGQHEVEKLFHARTKERPSCCFNHKPRTPIKQYKDILEDVSDSTTVVNLDYSPPPGLMQKAVEHYKSIINSAFKIRGHMSNAKPKKPIKKVSDKMRERLRLYYKVRETYLDGNIGCEAKLSGCNGTATEIHHKAGKTGDLLFNDDYFLAVCRPCHHWIEDNPREAKQMNLSTDRLNK